MSKKKSTENISELAEELEADKNKLQELIEALRSMLKEEKNLKVRTDDKFMLRFLRWQNYDPQAAFQKLTNWYKLKAMYPEWFSSTPPREHEKILNRQIHYMLPDRDSRGRRVYVVKMGNVIASQMTLLEVTHEDMLWIETALDEEETQRNGIAIIVDLSNFPYGLIRWLTPSNMRIGAQLMENLALQNIDYYVVNTSMFLNITIAIAFPFLSQKTKAHIHFYYQDWPLLHKSVNPEILPKEYGGQKSDIDYEKLQGFVYNNTDKLIESFSYGYIKET